MMALNIPMHPSSKTPMIALSRANASRSAMPSCCASRGVRVRTVNGRGSYRGRRAASLSHAFSRDRKYSSLKSSDHSDDYVTPALVIDPFRFSIPTKPGPLAAPVRDGEDGTAMRDEAVQERDAVLPYGFDHDQRRIGRMSRKTSIPYFCESMNPCCFALSYG